MQGIKFNEAINEKYLSCKKKMYNIKTKDIYIVPETGDITAYLNRGDILLEVEVEKKDNKREWIKINDIPSEKKIEEEPKKKSK